jgi:hypothetical protein
MAVSMHRQVHYSLYMYRWSLASGALVALMVAGFLLPPLDGIWQALGRLCLAGMVAMLMMYLLAWKNPAIKRLLDVDLREARG